MSTDNRVSFSEYLSPINPLTVGDLRKVIADLPDQVQILIAPTPEGAYSDWFNLSHQIGVPDLSKDDSEYSALTFFPVDNYDSRQF
jgi:predicted secreted protein